MKEMFDKLISELQNISLTDEFGKIVDLDEAIEVIRNIESEYKNNIANK